MSKERVSQQATPTMSATRQISSTGEKTGPAGQASRGLDARPHCAAAYELYEQRGGKKAGLEDWLNAERI